LFIQEPITMKTFFALALAAAAAGAQAAPPANIAGSTWTIQINRASDTLVINAQAGPGAPGNATCRIINGTLGIAPVRGVYCPDTGRITFHHRNIASGISVRAFTGNLSDELAGSPNLMAGTVMVLNAAFGDLGEYNFSASE
jgi:hypothetical protein